MSATELRKIEVANKHDVEKCCESLLTLWLQNQSNPSWKQLIDALKQVNLNRLAAEIERKLVSSQSNQLSSYRWCVSKCTV